MMPPFRLTAQQPSEMNEQISLATWLDVRKIQYCHVPNGGKRDLITGARLKRSGVKKGVPDILVFDRPPVYPGKVGTALELKRRSAGTVSPEQREWLQALDERGWIVAICKGWNEAVAFLESAGYGKADSTSGIARVRAVLGSSRLVNGE